MTDTRRAAAKAEVAALKRPFTIGVALVLVAMAALGFGIHAANAGNDRPEGAAERWLAAVRDTTRKGVGSDARKRAEEIGSLELAAPLLEGAKTQGKAAFPDLEVGGSTGTRTARVPYRLHLRTGGDTALKQGVVVLTKGDGWRVSALDVARPDERVPSEGGPVPSRAPLGAFVGAILLGVGVAFGCAGLIRWAGR